MRITEPMTMATDYLLAGVAASSALSLARRAARLGRASPRLWCIGFAIAAIAALAGGSFHGFRLHLDEAGRARLWTVTVWSIGLSATLFAAAGFHSLKRVAVASPEARARGKTWLLRAVAASLAGLAVLVLRVAPHAHFNHNDLYHVIQTVALCWLYLAALALHALEARAEPQGN